MTPPTTPPALSPELAAELEALRDIHLPDPVSWWPLAPGWWALLALILAAAIAIAVALHIRARTVRYRALRELEALRRQNDIGRDEAALGIEVLLKRIILQKPQHSALAASHGTRWVDHLVTGPGAMSPDIARFIAEAPYAPVAANENGGPDRAHLFNSAQKWIRRHA